MIGEGQKKRRSQQLCETAEEEKVTEQLGAAKSTESRIARMTKFYEAQAALYDAQSNVSAVSNLLTSLRGRL